MNALTLTSRAAALLIPLAIAFTAPAPLAAQEGDERETGALVDRLDPADVDRALVTRQGDVALLIDRECLLLQLTDEGLRNLRRDMRNDPDPDASLAQEILGAMFRAGLRTLFDNAMAFPIAEIGRADVIDGRLVLENRDGEDLFDITLNDRDILEDFDPAEARRFAREIRSRM